MDLLNLLIDPKKLETTCFLCFTHNDNSVSVYKTFLISDKYYNSSISLQNIMKNLFSFHDIALAQACEKCTDLIINIYTVIRRNNYKRVILNKIVDLLNGEIDKTNHEEKELRIHVKLMEFENNLEKNSISQKNFEMKTKLLKQKDSTIEFDSNYKAVSLKNSNKSLICDQCGKMFKTPNSLKSHINCHNVQQCPYCLKTLKSHTHFNLHVKKHLSNVKQQRKKIYYNCHDCNYKSLNKKSLEAHVNKVHLFIKPFLCDLCSKGFYKKSNLIEHKKTHEKTKNETCEKCGEGFVSKKTLFVHLKLHSDEKMYECQMCTKKFVTSGQRLEHFKRTHVEKSEICVICNTKYGLKKDLKRHLKKVHSQNVEKFLPFNNKII